MTLVFVPAGEFTMGSDADDALAECQKFRSDCQRRWFTNEEPPHSVNVDAFWIDQTEVTNRMYALCVEAGVCQEPTSTGSDTHSSYYGNPEFDNYPVIYVDWSMAKTYCEWADRRLPTEAEWEKAARGENASVYPWGDTFDGSLVNFCDTNCSSPLTNKSFNDGFADVAPVGSYPSGKSVYGALDMAGNVWEWVSSLYEPYPYDATDGRENLTSSDLRVLRGGTWIYDDILVRSAYRRQGNPSSPYSYIGFRCSRSL
jgi:eukaryotic-like serine/threonine-protein kinase